MRTFWALTSRPGRWRSGIGGLHGLNHKLLFLYNKLCDIDNAPTWPTGSLSSRLVASFTIFRS
jgi:hypothetical protein